LAFTLLATTFVSANAKAQIGGWGGQIIHNISSGAANLDPTYHPHPQSVSTMNDPVYPRPSNPPYQQPPQYQPPPPNYQQMYYQDQQKLYQKQLQAQQAQQYQAQLQAQQAQQQYQAQLQAQQAQYQQQYWQQNPGAALGVLIGDVVQAATQ